MNILQLSSNLSKNSSKDQIWDSHKTVSYQAQQAFLSSTSERQLRRGERMASCAPYLIFRLLENQDSKEVIHKLRYAEFCRVRLCPICMWRKSMAWRARFYEAWPRIISEYPKARYFHLVLTVPNCEIFDLRSVLNSINEAWDRMASRNTWPAIGFIRSVEVTRDRKGFAHPHVHVLMMVNANYFDGKNYMSRDDWREYWLSALRIPLDSNYIHPFIRAINGLDNLANTVLEVSKYAVKMKSMESILRNKPGQKWFLELDSQLSKTKAVTLGGIIRLMMRETEISDEELLHQEKDLIGDLIKDVRYDWILSKKSYVQTQFLDESEIEWLNKLEEKWKKKRCN